MSVGEIPGPISRAEWQAREGFLFVGEVAIRLMDTIQEHPPSKITDTYLNSEIGEIRSLALNYSANASLYYTTKHLSEPIPDVSESTGAFQSKLGVTQEDIDLVTAIERDRRQTIFRYGIGELEFSWQFAAGVASQLSYHFINEGYLKQNQLNAFTLTDWANIIGTGWFSKLMHSMAYTRNGVYRGYGSKPDDYKPTTLWDSVRRELVDMPGPNDMFKVGERTEEEDGYSYVTASLTRDMTKALRGGLTEINNRDPEWSGGCPVARYGTVVTDEMVDGNPHIESLVKSGHIKASSRRNDKDKVRLQMEWSPIDIALSVFAQKLEEYDRLYGTPSLNYQSSSWRPGNLTHERRLPQEALRRAIDIEN